MKKSLFVTIIILFSVNTYAQSYNQEKTALTNFLVRMYKAEPFEGVKVVSDYDNNYLLSVVLVTPSKTPSATNRIARTIADLEACADILDHHIMEAIAYRNLDRSL